MTAKGRTSQKTWGFLEYALGVLCVERWGGFFSELDDLAVSLPELPPGSVARGAAETVLFDLRGSSSSDAEVALPAEDGSLVELGLLLIKS